MPALLTNGELIHQVTLRPGLIPARIDALNRRIVWVDLGKYHCYEGFFEDALMHYGAFKGAEPPLFESAVESLPRALGAIAEAEGFLPPSAFIFHAGRCGSTLLARVLARSRSNLVLGEVMAHNQIWNVMPESSGKDLYRSLLLAMGRRRLPSYSAHIVKFSSYNIVKFDIIRAAFPTTPALFLFREPARLLDSYYREPAPWMGKDFGLGKTWRTPVAAAEDFFHTALKISDPAFRCLEYSDLTSSRLPAILRYFAMAPSISDLRHMLAEFAWDAKSTVPRLFVSRSPESASIGSDRLSELYVQLQTKARLDWVEGPG